jgi:hypothetical protein
MMITPEQEEEEEPDWLDDGGDEEAAAKHKGEEGKAGKEDSEQENKKLAIKGPKDNEDLELKKARDMEVAMNAGIASELQVASPWGTSSESIGSDAIHALGNLQGDSFGEARGFGGLGLHGAGRGGGGISERGIGLANVGTAGRGGGGRGGSGYGKGAGDLGERRARVPKIVPGRPNVQGSLDKEIIRRVVRQHRREIKYCYESQLQKNKNLKGRVVVRFTISATGSVVSAVVKQSNLKNAAVERCMTGKIRRWVFPGANDRKADAEVRRLRTKAEVGGHPASLIFIRGIETTSPLPAGGAGGGAPHVPYLVCGACRISAHDPVEVDSACTV